MEALFSDTSNSTCVVSLFQGSLGLLGATYSLCTMIFQMPPANSVFKSEYQEGCERHLLCTLYM